MAKESDEIFAAFLRLDQEERENLNRNISAFPLQFFFANDAISAISSVIVGYIKSNKAVGFYLSQISINLCLAMLSALRQHRVQVYGNLRLAVEHSSLAAYALHHSNLAIFFSNDPEKPIDHKRLLKEIAYPWLSKNYNRQSIQLKNVKDDINENYAHANINHARMNLKLFEDKFIGYKTNYTDIYDPLSIKMDLCQIGNAALTSIEALLSIDSAVNVLKTRSSIRSEVAHLIVNGNAAWADCRGS